MFRTLARLYEKTTLALLAGLLLLSAGGPVSADDGFVVIVNASNPAASVSREELSRIFLKKTGQWQDGSRAQPVDLVDSSAVRGHFSQAVHGKDTPAIKAYWQKQIFSGRGVPPAELGSAAEVMAFVKANRGAVGYVAAGTALGGSVKAISLTP
jgi:ABC-type phosphate transport system substrate-binding protein